MAQLIRNFFIPALKIPLILLVYGLQIVRRQVMGGRVIVKRGDVFYIPMWIPIALVIALFMPTIWGGVTDVAHRVYNRLSSVVYHLSYPAYANNGEIAPFFAPSVQHWSTKIDEWSTLYNVDTQLMATVMQIESCGHPSVVSSAGARGLFQVMPFHFEDSENMIDPDTNAKRGGLFLNYCYNASGGDVGLTLACYNGGPSVINRPISTWASETKRYYQWGVGIYSDAIVNLPQSETLNQWMNAGGSRLCTSALNELGSYSSRVAASS